MSENIYKSFGISDGVFSFGENMLSELSENFNSIDKNAEYNQAKVLNSFMKNKVSAECMNGSSGYGYGDIGRDTLERVYADCFGTEEALVRSQITCGTHALSNALSAILRSGDTLLCPAGGPYDTLEEVIGIRPSKGSLMDFGVKYRQIDLKPDGGFDYDAIGEALSDSSIKVAEIQRSKGYQMRSSFTITRLSELIRFIHDKRADVCILVDNCYGEFVERTEPSECGADLIAGSLIKNPGGGLAPIGGYIAGRRDLIELCANRLTAPGLGREVGASLSVNRDMFEGFFLAPTVTASALKGAIFAAKIYDELGFKVIPAYNDMRTDIIQAIELKTKEGLIAFCEGIQEAAPVDSYVRPEPWDMPGYEDRVIMAAGSFVSGASIELSADGPLREPYAVYFQGGLTWAHAKFGILKSLQKLCDEGIVNEAKLC